MDSAAKQLTPEVRAGMQKRFAQIVVMVLVEAALLFISAGRLDWLEAWVFVGVFLIGIGINAVLMLRYSPETIARRASSEGVKGWDRLIGGLFGFANFGVLLVVAGLDERFGWSAPLPVLLWWAAIIGYVLGSALFSWAMLSNAYFSTVVRVQTESGHRVCTTGPYRYVRHPGYVGGILSSLVLPLMLGSVWALIPGVIAVVLLVIRTALEDQTLQQELDGYPDYARNVRYRLLPGVW